MPRKVSLTWLRHIKLLRKISQQLITPDIHRLLTGFMGWSTVFHLREFDTFLRRQHRLLWKQVPGLSGVILGCRIGSAMFQQQRKFFYLILTSRGKLCFQRTILKYE